MKGCGDVGANGLNTLIPIHGGQQVTFAVVVKEWSGVTFVRLEARRYGVGLIVRTLNEVTAALFTGTRHTGWIVRTEHGTALLADASLTESFHDQARWDIEIDTERHFLVAQHGVKGVGLGEGSRKTI